jgi:predicted metal-dependent peptidase
MSGDADVEDDKALARKAMDHITEARIRLFVENPWYASIATKFNYIRRDNVNTMGVSLHNDGQVKCWYNVSFILSLKIPEISAVLIHEIQHILREHITRMDGLSYQSIFNMAADFSINGIKEEPDIKNLPKMGCFVPLMKNGDVTPEFSYLKQEIKDRKLSRGSTSEDWYKLMADSIDSFQPSGKTLDNHDIWKESTATKDQARAIAKDFVSTANSCGNCPRSMVEVIERLNENTYDWKAILKTHVGRINGGFKRKTYSRVNRRLDTFGTKGNSRHSSSRMTIAIDNSGSVCSEMLEQFFAEIDKISQYFNITLLQFDCSVQGEPQKYKKGDWKNFEVIGRGGTCFNAPLDYMEEHGIIGRINIILSDGEAPPPSERKYPVIWCFYNPNKNIGEEFWGQVITIDPRDL